MVIMVSSQTYMDNIYRQYIRYECIDDDENDNESDFLWILFYGWVSFSFLNLLREFMWFFLYNLFPPRPQAFIIHKWITSQPTPSAHSIGLLANDNFIVLAQMTYDLVDVRNAFQKRKKKQCIDDEQVAF